MDAWAGQTYTWLASPVDANWNTTSLDWTAGGAADSALRLTSTKTPVVYFDTGSSMTNDFTSIYISGTPTFKTGSNDTFTYKCPIIAENTAGYS